VIWFLTNNGSSPGEENRVTYVRKFCVGAGWRRLSGSPRNRNDLCQKKVIASFLGPFKVEFRSKDKPPGNGLELRNSNQEGYRRYLPGGGSCRTLPSRRRIRRGVSSCICRPRTACSSRRPYLPGPFRQQVPTSIVIHRITYCRKLAMAEIMLGGRKNDLVYTFNTSPKYLSSSRHEKRKTHCMIHDALLV